MAARYEVIRELGAGGMGRVFEAVHHPSERAVAVKTMREELAESRPAQRLLLNEATAAAQIAHPNIVELLDVGRDARGAMFLVMELVRGASLDAWLSSFPGLPAILRAFDQILDALATAHAQGVVHGDLKPANLLATPDGLVKIADFGVAHVIDPLRADESRGVQGTPFYMAPEQLVDPSAIGPPTDLYAVGVMLYELLGEHEPFPSGQTLPEIIANKVTRLRPFVPRAGVSVPPELGALVMRLLDPEPRMRPRFAARVRAELAEMSLDAEDTNREGVPEPLESADTVAVIDLENASTVESTVAAPRSRTSQKLPFSLPCADAFVPELGLHALKPLPLVGRSAEAARLRAAIDDVVAGRGARALLVSGRAGEGKTRLVRQGFADVERTGVMLGAAASFDETISHARVGLRASVTRLLGKPAETLDETLAGPWRWLTTVAQPGVDLSRAHDWLADDERSFEANDTANVAADCVLAVSRVVPVYLWLDDVAWSRDGAMELLLRLLERNDARVLAVGTLRSGTAEHPRVRAWLARAIELGARHEVLGALGVDERAELVSKVAPIEPALARTIAEELDEPALVVVETVRAWAEDGGVATTVRLRSPSAVFARRVALLVDGFGPAAAAAERVLVHAALLGLRFEDRALRACAGIEADVDRVLDRALLSGLLRADGHDAYRFEHRLFLDATAERIARRRDASEIRNATARALVATYGRRFESTFAAAQLHRAGGDDEAAMRLARQAVFVSVRASRFERSTTVLDTMASWVAGLPEGHLHRAVYEAARGQHDYYNLDYASARAHLERALAIFEAVGTKADVHATLYDLSSAHFYDDRFSDAERLVSFVHEPVVSPISHALAYHRLAELAAMRDDLDAAIAHERRARALFPESNVAARFSSNVNVAAFQVSAGRIDDAIASAAIAREEAERVDDHQLADEVEHILAVVDMAQGEFEQARGRVQTWLDSLRARGDRWQTTYALSLAMLCAAGTNDAHVERAVTAFVEAYAAVPHDEAITCWAVGSTAARLRSSGRNELAARLDALLDARRERIQRGFAKVEEK